MRLTLDILLADDTSPRELDMVRRTIQEYVEDHDSGTVIQADWVECNGTKIVPESTAAPLSPDGRYMS